MPANHISRREYQFVGIKADLACASTCAWCWALLQVKMVTGDQHAIAVETSRRQASILVVLITKHTWLLNTAG